MFSSQSVVSVKRIKVRRNNEFFPTNTMIILLTHLHFLNRTKLDTWITLLYYKLLTNVSQVWTLGQISAVTNWHVQDISQNLECFLYLSLKAGSDPFQLYWKMVDHLLLNGFKDGNRFQHLWSIRLRQSAITDATDPISLSTSILKDIPILKRFNEPLFSDTFINATKERKRALERFQCEPTEGNLDAYRIARAKTRRDIRDS